MTTKGSGFFGIFSHSTRSPVPGTLCITYTLVMVSSPFGGRRGRSCAASGAACAACGRSPCGRPVWRRWSFLEDLVEYLVEKRVALAVGGAAVGVVVQLALHAPADTVAAGRERAVDEFGEPFVEVVRDAVAGRAVTV